MTLLPPNATPLERALEHGTARLGAVAAPVDTLVDPARIPVAALPWLAFGFSVDLWETSWPEAVKRAAVADSIAQHRIKGTRASVEHVLARINAMATIVEAHESGGRLPPHTFEVNLPILNAVGDAGVASAAMIDEIVAQISTVKPLREHLRVVQTLLMTAGARVGLQGAARLASYTRDDADLIADASPVWDFYLQTEQGEPIQAETGTFLDTAP